MTKTMTRGKQQILFNYLPGKTFDFERGPIARVVSIHGVPQSELNETVIVRKVAEHARAWTSAYRPGFPDHTLGDASKFILLDPVEVDAEMYPRILWCQNSKCLRVIDASKQEEFLSGSCPVCKIGKLVQIRWVKVHRCGAIDPLTPPDCPKCHSRNISLSTRESERLQAFRWVCRKCDHHFSLFAGPCRSCEWPDTDARNMDIEVHRAGRTYYPQSAVLLNIPSSDLEGLLSTSQWECIVAARFLGLPEFRSKRLSEYTGTNRREGAGISNVELEKLLAAGLNADQVVAKLKDMQEAKQNASGSANEACASVSKVSGVASDVWKRAGPELLEAIIPFESDSPPIQLKDSIDLSEERNCPARLGLQDIALAPDYTIVNATFGYTRVDYRPDACWLNTFPPDRRYKGRLPVYADRVQADALLVSLDPDRVVRWLQLNGVQPNISGGTDAQLSTRAYFVKLFDGASLFHTIGPDAPERRMVFGLLHTLSHISVRQASLLCGLERTSLSEYLIPKALTFALYCNHRFGATIGALTALYEQTLQQWLNSLRDARTCVYDPVCADHEGSCHACTHLAETSCRFFNLNLSRAFLFGGRDRELGEIQHGYFTLPPAP